MSNRALTFVYLRQTKMIPNMYTPDNHNQNQIISLQPAGGLVFEKMKLFFDFPKSVQVSIDVESRFDFCLLAPNRNNSKYVITIQPQSKPNQ